MSKNGKDNKSNGAPDSLEADNPNRRFLQCPGSVTVNHLKKFIITKYGLDDKFVVDVIYRDDLLAEDNSLIDVAYSYNWRKVETHPNSHLWWFPPFPSNSFLLPPLDRHHSRSGRSQAVISFSLSIKTSMVEIFINVIPVADQSDAILLQNLPKDKSADS